MAKKPLTLDEAIDTALEYENNVRDMYKEAATQATEESGRKFFEKMAKEEQVHVTYLKARKKEWTEKGKLNVVPVKTATPTRDRIDEGLGQLAHKLKDYDWTLELELLRKARQMESETGSFYKRMVRELSEDGAALFSGFLAIEDAHYDLVQSQIEALEGGGFWFNTQEFTLEG